MQPDSACAPGARQPRTVAPGPRGHWLTGSLADFRRDSIGLLARSAQQHGDLVRFRFAHVVVHLANHPDLIRHVLVTESHNFDKATRSVAKIRAVCGDSLLTSDGEAWLAQRRLLQPAFQLNQLRNLPPLIAAATGEMLQQWRVSAGKDQPIDVVAEMMHVVYRISARSFFGVQTESDANVVEQALAVVLDHTWLRLERLIDWGAICPWLAGRNFRAAIRDFDQVVYRIVSARQGSQATQHDLLSHLLRADCAGSTPILTARQLRDHILTMLLTGHETTANLLAWALVLSSLHPEMDERLMETAAVEAPSGAQSEAVAGCDSFLNRMLKETLRLFPSIWIIERRVRADDALAGYRLPAHSTVVISPYVLHRHPAFWDDPDRFDPDRFLRVPEADQFDHAYMPFGAGPHQCVGQHMATIIAGSVLRQVLSACRLRPAGPVNLSPQPGITLRHRQPQWMSVEFREAR